MSEIKDIPVKRKGGLKKGQTNNPFGRPVGCKNKVSLTVKKRIVDYVETNFDGFIEDVGRLEPRDRVKSTIELLKLVVPRPISDEEKDGMNKLYGGLAHLFGAKDETKGE